MLQLSIIWLKFASHHGGQKCQYASDVTFCGSVMRPVPVNLDNSPIVTEASSNATTSCYRQVKHNTCLFTIDTSRGVSCFLSVTRQVQSPTGTKEKQARTFLFVYIMQTHSIINI